MIRDFILYISTALLGSALFFSCAKSEDFKEDIKEEQLESLISFENSIVGSTKAQDKTGSTWWTQDDAFGVLGYNHADNVNLVASEFGSTLFMENTKVYRNPGGADNRPNTRWIYDFPVNWPRNNEQYSKLSFFAYHPWQGLSENTPEPTIAGGVVSFDFKVNTDVTQQADLLWATTKNKTKPGSGAGINFSFDHALSKLIFKAKTDKAYADVQIYITELSVTASSKGTYSFNVFSDSGVWSALAEPYTYTVIKGGKTRHRVKDGTAIAIGTTISGVTTSGSARDYELLMIPHPAANTRVLSLTYEFVFPDSGVIAPSSTTVEYDISKVWVGDNQYEFVFNIGYSVGTGTIVEVGGKPWMDGEEIIIK